ncbi:glycosyltransferase [Szabonella alba]|uniref:Glycosyltransferase n=1 Tax=Szabonella alba TaxID=2804194 RepID=A0A8K0VAG7_9RHOB|nr:glycosyltransferase [Szabonella alba]MBL4918472.1 glycosyltransferase [Szabonella alba]
MKIAYLVNTYPRASQTFIRREIQALERQSITLHRFAMRSDRDNLVDAADLAEDARTEHVLELGAARLGMSALGWMLRHPGRTWAALRLALDCGTQGAGGVAGTGGRLRHLIYLAEAAHVARRCRDLGITHLHAHFGTNSTTVAMLAHALGGPRYSFTTHGPEEFDAPHAHSLGEKLRHAAFAVAISSFGRSQLCRQAAFADWPRIHVVHCGIEPARFATPAPLPPGGPHLVAIGRLAEQKGFPLLIAAMAEAARDLPGLRLTILGDGPLRRELETAIAAQGLQAVVHLAGWADEKGVRAALAAAQALILPSFAEGLPVVVMEAMAAGRPVIATAIAGLPELVREGREGWLVPAGDAGALARAIRDLAATPPERLAGMGVAARDRVLARHDINREATRLAALFAGVAQDGTMQNG